LSRWSDTKLTEDELREEARPKVLVAVILDQQYDYWYDPCGKSGHDLNRSLTKRSRIAVRRLRDLVEAAGPDELNVARVRTSNRDLFLTRVLVASIGPSGSIGGLTAATLRRLKDLTWHGVLVPKTVLDEIVDAVEESK
jgi:hypothetical protein